MRISDWSSDGALPISSGKRLCRGPFSGGLLAGLGGALEHAHDVRLLHDQQVLAVELDLGAGPLAEQHTVAGLDVERLDLAGFVENGSAPCRESGCQSV